MKVLFLLQLLLALLLSPHPASPFNSPLPPQLLTQVLPHLALLHTSLTVPPMSLPKLQTLTLLTPCHTPSGSLQLRPSLIYPPASSAFIASATFSSVQPPPTPLTTTSPPTSHMPSYPFLPDSSTSLLAPSPGCGSTYYTRSGADSGQVRGGEERSHKDCDVRKERILRLFSLLPSQLVAFSACRFAPHPTNTPAIRFARC